GDLEGAHQPQACDVGRPPAGDVAPIENNAPGGRGEEAGEQVEAGGLAGAVGTDQCVDGPAAHAQIHATDRHEAPELLRQVVGFEDDVSGHCIGALTRLEAWVARSREFTASCIGALAQLEAWVARSREFTASCIGALARLEAWVARSREFTAASALTAPSVSWPAGRTWLRACLARRGWPRWFPTRSCSRAGRP